MGDRAGLWLLPGGVQHRCRGAALRPGATVELVDAHNHVKAANPAYERLLQDYVDYHLALVVVVGGFFAWHCWPSASARRCGSGAHRVV